MNSYQDNLKVRLIKLYSEYNTDLWETARLMQRSEGWVIDKLNSCGIKIRESEEEQKIVKTHFKYYSNDDLKENMTKISDGYEYTRVFGEWVPTSKVIWEKKYGKLDMGWVVHHIDSNKMNNNISNLVALPYRIHCKLHWLYSKDIKIIVDKYLKMFNSKINIIIK
jgi:hypothetical protein